MNVLVVLKKDSGVDPSILCDSAARFPWRGDNMYLFTVFSLQSEAEGLPDLKIVAVKTGVCVGELEAIMVTSISITEVSCSLHPVAYLETPSF